MPEPPQLPPIATQPITVLLLGRSDQPGLEKALDDWIGYVNGLDHEHEILLIDDALLDRTEEMARRHPGVRVLRDPVKRGVGAALRLGVAEAKHPLLFHAPCDGRYQPKDFRLLLAEVDKTDLVVGHRVGRSVPRPLRALGFAWRGLARVLFGLPLEPLPAWLGWRAYLGNLLARMAFGLRLHDVQCDFRLFRRSIFRRIPIQSDGPFAHVEVLAKANFLTAIMTEVPVTPQPVASTACWWRDAWRVFAHPDFGPAVLPEEAAIEPLGACPDSTPSPNGPVAQPGTQPIESAPDVAQEQQADLPSQRAGNEETGQ
jgi:hypothetical protein